MSAPIAPGVVTSLDPFLVKLGADGVAQPCQRVAPAQIGQRGGVLILGGQRVWLGAYDQNDIDVSGLVARLDQLERKASGTVTVSVNASAGGSAAVSFPTGRFTSADTLNISLTKLSGGLAKYVPYATVISATGMTVGLYSGDGSATTGSVAINWTASVAPRSTP